MTTTQINGKSLVALNVIQLRLKAKAENAKNVYELNPTASNRIKMGKAFGLASKARLNYSQAFFSKDYK